MGSCYLEPGAHAVPLSMGGCSLHLKWAHSDKEWWTPMAINWRWGRWPWPVFRKGQPNPWTNRCPSLTWDRFVSSHSHPFNSMTVLPTSGCPKFGSAIPILQILVTPLKSQLWIAPCFHLSFCMITMIVIHSDTVLIEIEIGEPHYSVKITEPLTNWVVSQSVSTPFPFWFKSPLITLDEPPSVAP